MGRVALNWCWRVSGLHQEGAVHAEAGKALLGRPYCSQSEARVKRQTEEKGSFVPSNALGETRGERDKVSSLFRDPS